MVDLYTPVGAARNDSLYVAACEIGAAAMPAAPTTSFT
jgi:hypothetical protein